MKRQAIYCLLTLAALMLSSLAYSSPDSRRDNTKIIYSLTEATGKDMFPPPRM